MLDGNKQVERPSGGHGAGCPDPERGPETGRSPWPVAETICRVLRNEPVAESYKHLVLDAPDGAAKAVTGQFFHLLCPVSGEHAPLLRRPMSIYRIDRVHGRLEFLYKVVGAGTATLAELREGSTLNIFGPLGRGFSLDGGHRHVIQVARGVGLATLAPVAEGAVARGARVTAILSARSPAHLMSVDYLKSAGAEVITVTDSEGTAAVENVEGLVRRLIETQGGDFLVTCGSNRLLLLLQRLASEYDIGGEVALEQRMGCGIGMCFACVREFRTPGGGLTYRRVCSEGPVFNIEEATSW